MAATRREVAQAAGVSLRTVSNVVNNFANVAPETRARVLNVIEALDYRPSEIARMLKRGRSGLIALVLPELDTPYFAELTRAFVELGAAHGYTVVIDQTDGDVERERELISQTDRGALIDGLVVSPIGLQSKDLRGISPERPVVFLGEDSHTGFDQVMIDNFAASRDAVTHLIAQGKTRVAAIGAQRTYLPSSTIRLAGYKQALQDAGIPFDPSLVAHVDAFRRADGAAAMAQLLDGPSLPDAVFCFSDPLALGAMWVLHQRNLQIPHDVAVVGFDDIEDGRYSTPSLTSVSPDKHFIAAKALDLLSSRLEGTNVAPASYLAPYTLVVRGSSSEVS
ncbi:MAG: LacI family transcriptional regulator [Microbacteriaceae bacterium]|nr:LacI family transcriptional regulator [Microbacteriaceae bacterium]